MYQARLFLSLSLFPLSTFYVFCTHALKFCCSISTRNDKLLLLRIDLNKVYSPRREEKLAVACCTNRLPTCAARESRDFRARSITREIGDA